MHNSHGYCSMIRMPRGKKRRTGPRRLLADSRRLSVRWMLDQRREGHEHLVTHWGQGSDVRRMDGIGILNQENRPSDNAPKRVNSPLVFATFRKSFIFNALRWPSFRLPRLEKRLIRGAKSDSSRPPKLLECGVAPATVEGRQQAHVQWKKWHRAEGFPENCPKTVLTARLNNGK